VYKKKKKFLIKYNNKKVIKIEKIVITNSKNLKEKIRYCLETINFKPSSKEFVLKPNICSKYKSGSGHITNVKIVDELIELLIKNYAAKRIIIAEGPSLYLKEPMELFEYAGYKKLVKKFPEVSLVDIYHTKYKKADYNFKVPELLDNRCLINLPVLKGHPQAILTCAIKNLKGLLTREDKKKFHREGLHSNLPSLVDFNPELTLVDATICQDCTGDLKSKKYKFDLLLCAKNPILVDVICAKLVGIDINEIPYLKALVPKEKLNYEIIGEFRQLANWKPYKNKFTFGKIDVYINDCCSGCIVALYEYLIPKKLKKLYILGIAVKILSSYFKKQRTSYIMGKTMENCNNVKGDIILFGECAKNIISGIHVKGCPPLPE
jgi:uncharacterized protein (DUF362 family)